MIAKADLHVAQRDGHGATPANADPAANSIPRPVSGRALASDLRQAGSPVAANRKNDPVGQSATGDLLLRARLGIALEAQASFERRLHVVRHELQPASAMPALGRALALVFDIRRSSADLSLVSDHAFGPEGPQSRVGQHALWLLVCRRRGEASPTRRTR
jgi:hypothetical protein